MSLLAEIIASVFTVFGMYCALRELRGLFSGLVRRRRLRFDIGGGQMYNNDIIIREESRNAEKSDGK